MITTYFWDMDRLYSGTAELDENGAFPENSTFDPPPVLQAKEYALWTGYGWTVTTTRPSRVQPPIDALAIDAERDRRVALGFTFQDHHYQTRTASDRENILGAMNTALAAMMAGAKAGDLRWADPETDFVWIASDNQRVPMDAQTTLAFGQAATARKSQLVLAGSSLKAMTPIPQDFATDDRWPA
ncbi:hypothetical protein NS376_14055 [Pseudomonas oryzihabitans]|nr:hypothetical protein NS376_14055 [Pseudomonas psychrotolerans]KTT57660.1 hypothetical protein SB8_12565 [Pseudomonas psychrotolerans]